MKKLEWINGQLKMNHGSFHTSILKSWVLASPENKVRLEESLPEYFTFNS